MRWKEHSRYRLISLLTAVLLLWGLGQTPALKSYFDAVKGGGAAPGAMKDFAEEADDLYGMAVPAMAHGSAKVTPLGDSELLNRIKKEAETRNIPPVDAKVDRVWKAIPGLNGRSVDVEKTFQLAKRHPASEPIPFVYRTIPPAVGLKDLGAHPIYKGNPQKKMIALMINVAWGDEFLPGMLQTLRDENVHATFFFDGTWLSKNIEAAKKIGEEGHELSNHAYSHKNMSQLSRSAAMEEIRKTQQLLDEKVGVKNGLFAPPSGDFDQETVDIAHGMGLQTVLWTFDTVDWKKPDPEVVLSRFRRLVEPGTLVLMHPTEASSKALPGLIKEAKKQGLALGTVSELISPERLPELESGRN